MDINYNTELELERVTQFKDSVLSQAEAKGMELIAQAGRVRSKELELMQRSCDDIQCKQIETQLAQESERELSALMQQSRRELLQTRNQLVDEIFAQVTGRIADFTQSEAYVPHLLRLLEPYREKAAGGGFTLLIREEDKRLQSSLLEAFPFLTLQISDHIRLGGLQITDGKVLFDLTFDRALEDQKNEFYHSGKLTI